MPTIFPPNIAPTFSQFGVSAQRMAAVTFFPQSIITPTVVIPLNIGVGSYTTDAFNVAGFNTFMVIAAATTNNLTFLVNHVDPRDQVSILFTRSIVAIAAGGGATLIPFGFGNALASCGVDVPYFISLTFTGALANATLSQFPGLWGCVR